MSRVFARAPAGRLRLGLQRKSRRFAGAVEDDARFSSADDYPTEIGGFCLAPGFVVYVARVEIFSVSLISGLAARSVDDFLLFWVVICVYQLDSFEVKRLDAPEGALFVIDKRSSLQ